MTHWKTTSLAALALILIGNPGLAAGAAPESLLTTRKLDDLVDRVEIGYQRRDLGLIGAAREELLAVAPADPEAAYLAAYSAFRMALVAGPDASTARRHLGVCIDELEALGTGGADEAQRLALLGSCHGISTRYSTSSLVTQGLQARRALAAARTLSPDDPWVIMQDGMADFATPRLFGGDRREAIRKLERAAALFESALSVGSHRAAWGAYEAWQQLAQMRAAVGLKEAAQAAMLQAESVAPRLASLPERVAANR